MTFTKRVRYENDSSRINQIVIDHCRSCGPNRPGAILVGVCRGKLSEGIDFKDDQARLVIIVGVPFANVYEPTNIMKAEMMNKENFLEKQALRTVNQSIGRVIRHLKDFGAIVLIDKRYEREDYKEMISCWLKGRLNDNIDMKQNDQLSQICFRLKNLMSENLLRFPQEECKIEDIEVEDDRELSNEYNTYNPDGSRHYTSMVTKVEQDSNI